MIEDLETIPVVTRHLDRMIDQLLRIRALHQATASSSGGTNCAACSHFYPCPTIRILNGKPE